MNYFQSKLISKATFGNQIGVSRGYVLKVQYD